MLNKKLSGENLQFYGLSQDFSSGLEKLILL